MSDLYQAKVLDYQLANGITVKLLPMPGFHQTYAMINVNVGSVDTRFQPANHGLITVPAGTAHYLEHKLFEKKIMMPSSFLAGWVPIRMLLLTCAKLPICFRRQVG